MSTILFPTPLRRVVRTLVCDLETRKFPLVRAKKRPTVFELPGGKVDPSEDVETAAYREMFEETGLVPEFLTCKYRKFRHHPTDPSIISEHFLFFGTLPPASVPRINPKEILEVRMTTIYEALELPLEWFSSSYLHRVRPATARLH